MDFKKIHHAALSVKNLKKSIDWYKETLGFTLIHEYHHKEWNVGLLKLGECYLELIQLGKPLSLPIYRTDLISDIRTIGTKHICLQVADLENVIKKLKKRGVTIATEIDIAAFGGKFAFIKDFDGILLELYEE